MWYTSKNMAIKEAVFCVENIHREKRNYVNTYVKTNVQLEGKKKNKQKTRDCSSQKASLTPTP